MHIRKPNVHLYIHILQLQGTEKALSQESVGHQESAESIAGLHFSLQELQKLARALEADNDQVAKQN